MRNRAKCALCESIIESFTLNDYVECKCGEIGISGGKDKLLTAAKDYINFLRVNDDDTITPVKEKDSLKVGKLTKDDLLKELEQHLKNIESLPAHGLNGYVTNYDLWSSLTLILAILRC